MYEGPHQCENEWNTYFVNGYKIHTQTQTKWNKTINCGVVVKEITEGGEDNFYGVIPHIYELVYNYSWTCKIKLSCFIVTRMIHLLEEQK